MGARPTARLRQDSSMKMRPTRQTGIRSKTYTTRLVTLALGATLVLVVPHAQSQQFYRWVDDQGNVQYTDKIPPSEVDKGHTELSDDGMRVRTVPPAMTPEQIQRERELERLRAEQRRFIDQQKADDRVLLRSFRSMDDLIMVRDGKIAAVDVMIQVTKSNIRRQQNWLLKLRAEAAELERAGEPVTDELKERIVSSEQSLNQSLAKILERERQKQDIRETFSRDIKRFRQLKDIPEETSHAEEVTQPSLLANLVECYNERECERMWKAAMRYVKQHATVPIETEGNEALMTQAPDTVDDIALTLTRIWNSHADGASIFLDIQCRNYNVSVEACRTEARAEVLNGFRAVLEAS